MDRLDWTQAADEPGGIEFNLPISGWFRLFRDTGSLAAFWYLARCWSRTLVKRREIMRRRKASDDAIAEWFRVHPVSRPLHASIGPGVESDAGVRVAES